MDKPQITVVTVCYNAGRDIEKTICDSNGMTRMPYVTRAIKAGRSIKLIKGDPSVEVLCNSNAEQGLL